MNGEMIEAKTRHVDWSEVDVDTFVRLCEFAYFRDYTPPPFRLIESRIPLEATKTIKKKVKRKSRRSNVTWDPPTTEPEPEPESVPEPMPETPEPPDEAPLPEETVCDDPEIKYKE